MNAPEGLLRGTRARWPMRSRACGAPELRENLRANRRRFEREYAPGVA